MRESDVPETFIPYSRQRVVEMCLNHARWTDAEKKEFRKMAEILYAWVHFQFLNQIDALKRHYAPFDPDREVHLEEPSAEELEASEKAVVDLFRDMAEQANFFEITEEGIRKCFDTSTLIELKTEVDMEDFDRVLCFARGDIYKTADVKKWFRKREVKADILQRALLLLKFKDEEYFKTKKKKKGYSRQTFQPGKIYTYLYKDVPKYDLELLFPNVEVGMSLKDKILFGIPAIGGSVGVLFKALPQLMVVVGVILFFAAGPEVARKIAGVTEDSVNNFMPILTALMGLVIALGGLAFKQWSNYRKKRIEFLKDVSDQLFFRNLATNRSVFHRVIDAAEDEECKEMILALYHLQSEPDREWTRQELDEAIEQWMKKEFGTVIDFDIDDPIGDLKKIKGKLPDGREVSMLEEDEEGHLKVVSTNEASQLLDHCWDEAFQFTES